MAKPRRNHMKNRRTGWNTGLDGTHTPLSSFYVWSDEGSRLHDEISLDLEDEISLYGAEHALANPRRRMEVIA